MALCRTQRYWTVLFMMLGVFIALLNQTLLTTARPDIMASFDLSLDSAQWLTTIFMLVNGIMIPVSTCYTIRFSSEKLHVTALHPTND
ncbi:hypothetical protein FMV2238Y02_19950 [Streptococcus canis]|uniref:Uncharacterized protein n=1 Tax=Streptococcus canis TaxID=1329 RepID=A0A3P5Y5H3_STRCB|nr:hypothetical protein [Streptococcus canis]MDV5972255.1 hypothetical protein [Streptococcus canis]QKG78289.1 hypothetical protein GE021_009375 [Streptococcus canis]VDC43491.1 hypothetical protein FMV2238Y02_19950 [Streptococcus canis]